jgi:hypothetical protein
MRTCVRAQDAIRNRTSPQSASGQPPCPGRSRRVLSDGVAGEQGCTRMDPAGAQPRCRSDGGTRRRLSRIQVKTSTYRSTTPNGHRRWQVSIATSGGNQSWNGAAKEFDPHRVEHLFVLVGDGRRWLIPADVIEGSRAVLLGGTKYSEFEIEPGSPVESLVYPEGIPNRINSALEGECQSGQMDQTVNLTAMPTEVRILSPPSTSRQVLLRPKRQVTIPKLPCQEAGVVPGDRMRVRADGSGRVVFERIGGSNKAVSLEVAAVD